MCDRQNELACESKMQKREKSNAKARMDSLRKTFARHLVKYETVSKTSIRVHTSIISHHMSLATCLLMLLIVLIEAEARTKRAC